MKIYYSLFTLVLPLEINLPATAEIIEPDHSKYNDISDNEIKNLLDRDDLKSLIAGPDPILLVINDHHRSTPSKRILKALYQISPQNNIKSLIIATGTHEAPNDEEIMKLTGGYHNKLEVDLYVHNSNSNELISIGKTSRGTEIIINPIVKEFDKILCINSVEPHYFAGFTGGIKSIVPGLASKSTVETNHAWALSDKTGPTLIDNNPLSLDLWEALNMIKSDIFGIQMVNFQSEIYFISFGTLKDSFTDAAEFSKGVYAKKIKNKFDIIVSVIYPPLDRSLYQAQKGIENTRRVLKEGGDMILLAKCPNGIGNDEFYSTLKEYDSPSEVLNDITKETYKFGDHKAYNFASLANISSIFLLSNLNINQCRTVFAKNMRLEDLEHYLMTSSKNGKSILIALDTGSLSLFLE